MPFSGNQLGRAIVLAVALFLNPFVTCAETSADTPGSRNNVPRPIVFPVLQEVAAYRGGCTNRFHRGVAGDVVLDCGGEADIATMNDGQT